MSKALAAIAKVKSGHILKESDAEASFSSHDSDEEGSGYPGVKKFKREIVEDVFEENGSRNGMRSPVHDHEMTETPVNGSHGDLSRDAVLNNDESLVAKGMLPGYQTYSTDQKQEVVNYAKETTVREAARKYNVPRSTVQVWCKHGPQTRKEKRSPGGGGGRRLSYSNETDEKLLQWVLRQQEKGTPVTRDAIQSQARLLIRDECPEFKASSGWVEKFLARHNLTIATKMSSQNPNEAIPISYVVPVSSVPMSNPIVLTQGANSPRATDGRSVTSEDTRSDSGKSEEDEEMCDASPVTETAVPIGHPVIREPPNLNEMLKPIHNASSPSSVGLKDEEDDDGEGEDGEADGEKPDPTNVHPERLKAFNMFVRLFVDENLDRLVPISKQPKEKILAIIQSCNRQFPEFRDRARKRIRTYLKSCRRLKKLKEPLKRAADQISSNPNMSAAQMAENILASACANEAENARHARNDDTSGATGVNMSLTSSVASPAPSSHPPQCSAQNTRNVDRPTENGGPTLPKPKVLTQCQISATEVQAIRQLIAGYRESAAFLYRSADELEALLPPL